MAKDDLNKRKEQLQAEYNLNEAILQQARTQKALSNEGISLRDELLGKLKDEKDLGIQITSINQAIDGLLQEQIERGDTVNQHYIDQLDRLKEIVEKEKERKDVQEEIKDLGKDFKDKMLGSLGTLGDMIKAGTAFGAGMVLAQKGIEMISSALSSTVGLAKELYTQTGATAAEAGRLGSQTMGAMFSMEGLLYGGEALATAAKDASDYYGSTKVITADMQKNITKLSAMGVQGATQMNAIFESASGNAGGLTAEIQAMAQDAGVNASEIFKEMEGSMVSMVGKSKEELKYLAEKTIQLKKQGLSVSQMESMSENMLNVESSLRAQMKARVFGMGEMLGDTEKLRAASMQIQFGDKAKGMEMMADAIKEAGITSEQLGNMGSKQIGMLAEGYGMSAEQLTDMVTKQEELAKIMEETGVSTTAEAIAIQEQQAAQDALKASVISYGASIGTAVLPALAQWFATKQAISALGSGTGGRAASAGGGAPGGGMLQGIANMPWQQILMGAAAMLIVAAAVFVFAKAVQEFMNVSWEAVGMAVVSMLALVAAVALLGTFMTSPIGAVAILAGAAAMLVIAAALLVLGYAVQEIAKGFEMMGNLTESLMGLITIAPLLLPLTGILMTLGVGVAALGVGLLLATPGILAFGLASNILVAAVPTISALALGLSSLVEIAPGLIALAGAFVTLGLAMLPLAFGLMLLTPFIGTILILGTMLPLIASAFGYGGESDSSTESGSEKDDLLEEIKGLRRDIQAQPIQIVIDDKVISTMNKKNVRMQSYRDQLK